MIYISFGKGGEVILIHLGWKGIGNGKKKGLSRTMELSALVGIPNVADVVCTSPTSV